MSVQPSITRSTSVNPPVCSVVKFISHSFCQPGSSVANHSGSIWLVVADVDRRRRALEHEQIAGGAGEVGDALHRRCAGADDPDPLVGEADHRRTLRVAAGVVVVPPAGVEAVPGERLDPRDAGQLRTVQRAGAHRQVLGAHLVAAVGADDPAVRRLVPLDLGDLGRQAGVVVQVEVVGDPLAVLEDLRRVRVLLGRHVAGLFEQREVDERRRVALRAGVAVPVPVAADVAALVDDPHVVDAGLLEPGAGDEPGEPAADERHGDLVGQRLARHDRCVRVVEVVGELPDRFDVLRVAVGPQPLLPLGGVLGPQGIAVDLAGPRRRVHRPRLPPPRRPGRVRQPGSRGDRPRANGVGEVGRARSLGVAGGTGRFRAARR